MIWEVTFSSFLLVTVVLSGGAAYLTGRTVAREWQPNSLLVIYVLLLTAATRFMHFALFHGTLLSVHYYLVDLAILLFFAFLGKGITRSRQMGTQYRFIFADRPTVLDEEKSVRSK